MLKPYTNMLAVFLILFGFAEQSMAYSVSSHSDFFTTAHTPAGLMVAPPLIDLPPIKASEAQETDDCCDVECCEINCICPANTCMPALYLPTAICSAQVIVQNHPSLKLNAKHPISISAFVYRPPIFIS
ncbi:hypothetical protein RC083_18120 [Pseudoalteromonas haloplanktis]|uniref:Uncharacterized protein n=1 Tax=Pseudoalteromonas haloplanktis TaxID=228 RepID=A0ABU1BHV7_PSEHA|nr:hypothetical protein [Pseudoalteromonas haloplanktis]MDQ9093489.1 hypothetical protein [Pseudoalteromonas haloplanktis]